MTNKPEDRPDADPGPPRIPRGEWTARQLALMVLVDCLRRESFVQEALDRRLSEHALSPADRRLATQLVYGVLRRRGTLEVLIEPLISRPLQQVEPWLLEVLQLGAYQLVYLDHIPVHAALHETVELAAKFGRRGAKGFLNGVLRSLSRVVTDETTTTPQADAIPLEEGRYRVLSQPVLPDPNENPVEYVAAGFALPTWLVHRWQRYSLEEQLRLGFWFASPSPLTLRVQPLRTSREALLARFEEANITTKAGEHPQAIRLGEWKPVHELPGYDEGLFSVQDETSMRVATALAPEPGSRVLDLCAAPGGKSMHLAELMQNQGEVIACDVDHQRLASVSKLASQLGLTIVKTHGLQRPTTQKHKDKDISPIREGTLPKGTFDAVLVDVPCSNTGVLGRRPEIRWRLHRKDLRELVPLQIRLALLAADRLKPGGVLVYSTCSIEPEENREVVTAVCQSRPEFQLEAEHSSIPGSPSDGGYWARLLKLQGTSHKLQGK